MRGIPLQRRSAATAASRPLFGLSVAAAVLAGCGSGVGSPAVERSATSLTVLAAPQPPPVAWTTVVNDATVIPGTMVGDDPTTAKSFRSYNPPSVNGAGLVVFRARSAGAEGDTLLAAAVAPGTGPVRGVFTRDMARAGAPVTLVARNRGTDAPDAFNTVPPPNDLDAPFNEFPSFPRIDRLSETIATRAQSRPVWEYTIGWDEATQSPLTTRVGTSGIYATPGGALMTAESLLGTVLNDYTDPLSYTFPWFQVPGVPQATRFDQFPGAPGLAGPSTIVFKGNWTGPNGGYTGVYYRNLAAASPAPAVKIADSFAPTQLSDGSTIQFGSTAPPSGAMVGTVASMVFVGLDVEEAPTQGGIYLARLSEVAAERTPKPLVKIGAPVPGFDGKPIAGSAFSAFGEALSFDGRYLSFWGAWGSETRAITLKCPTDGNASVIQACLDGSPLAPDGVTHTGVYTKEVPVNQGFFIHDASAGKAYMVARTGTSANGFLDFLFWNFSGRPPDAGGGDEPTLEPPRWRSSAFGAVSSPKRNSSRLAFKALEADGTVGIYLAGTGPSERTASVLLDTNTLATAIDPAAPTTVVDRDGAVLPTTLYVTTMGIERDGFRSSGTEAGGSFLAVNASMANADASVTWAGIYLSRVPNDD